MKAIKLFAKRPKFDFEELPPELRLLILSQLDAKERSNCRLVNRQFKEYIRALTNDLFIQINGGRYRYKYNGAHLLTGSYITVPLNEVLRNSDSFSSAELWARKVEQRARKLNPKRATCPKVPPLLRICYEDLFIVLYNVYANPNVSKRLMAQSFFSLEDADLETADATVMRAILSRAVKSRNLTRLKLRVCVVQNDSFIDTVVDVILANRSLEKFEFSSGNSYWDELTPSHVHILVDAFFSQDGRPTKFEIVLPGMEKQNFEEFVDVLLDDYAPFTIYSPLKKHRHRIQLMLPENRVLTIENNDARKEGKLTLVSDRCQNTPAE
ncbi:hypothetical protein QR680_018190 [Steinernema hermaphroditum]|uniref:F-box domain-containing protein n=1 Tax=Steinernema hermaphroditum TaxID=289476 RepID=A0AA39HHY1_9BILA|nr:hypothetical protein QR680_018190 [Steinernema hermaphroditum]